MKHWLLHAWLLAGLALGVCGLVIRSRHFENTNIVTRKAVLAVTSPADVASAISGLELNRAQRLLLEMPANAAELPELRARLALYRGDCDEARALLNSTNTAVRQATRELSQLAESCARAVSGARIMTDDSRGVWVRVQDDADAQWVQLLIDVAARARDATGARLGISLPRPLRIELVMDHASLSALTGLPLEAAETTGTVAVARWGRVTMLSPRSFAKGYPWQDTLAHEITHLLVTTATRDNAPLWLQEALAKRFETTWRSPRPLDNIPNQHSVARSAWQEGRSVGIEGLGASIALLPGPESARIAYAEVYDYLDFILQHEGWPALQLLLRDLRDLGAEGTNRALVSVTGYTEQQWITRWRVGLSKEHEVGATRENSDSGLPSERGFDIARRARLAELLVSRHAWGAVDQILSYRAFDSNQPGLRVSAGLAKLQEGEPESALEAIGTAERLIGLQGDWLALRGRALHELGRNTESAYHFDWALAYAPTDEGVCCEGRSQSDNQADDLPALLVGSARRSLCLAARGLAASAGHPPLD